MKSRNSGVLYFVAGLVVATLAIGGIYLSGGFGSTDDAVEPTPTAVTRRSETISPTATWGTTNTTTLPGGGSIRTTNLPGSDITDIYEEYPIRVACTGTSRGSGFNDLVGECEAYEGGFSFYSTFDDCIEDPNPGWQINTDYFICKNGGY